MEGVRVDEIAAAVFEESFVEAEIFKGASFGVGLGVGEEGRVKIIGAFGTVVFHDKFVGVEEGAHDIFGGGIEDALGGFAEGCGFWFFEEFRHRAVSVEGLAGGVVGADEGVVDVDLVFEDHEGDDVALGAAGEFVRIDDGGEVGERFGFDFFDGDLLFIFFVTDDVSEVGVVAGFSGDIPTSPAFGDGAGIVDGEGAGVEDGASGFHGDDGAGDEAGEAFCAGAGVAVEARLVAKDFW